MKIKITLLIAIMLLWASPAMAITLEELPEFGYEIQKFDIVHEPEPEKQGFWASRDSWTKEDTYWQIGVLVTQIVDRKMTIETAKNPELYYEENPLLPKQPTIKQVNRYFDALMLINPVISYLLPSTYRRIWQVSNIGAELYCINNCYNAGIRIEF